MERPIKDKAYQMDAELENRIIARLKRRGAYDHEIADGCIGFFSPAHAPSDLFLYGRCKQLLQILPGCFPGIDLQLTESISHCF